MSELEIWNELGNIYYNAGAFDEAIRAYHRAIELDRGCGQSFINLADIYIRKEFFAEAILMYQKGIELLKSPLDKAALWNRLGEVYLRQERYEEAWDAYQKAVDLDPDNEALKEGLAKMEDKPRLTPLTVLPEPAASVETEDPLVALPDWLIEPALPAASEPQPEGTGLETEPLPVQDPLQDPIPTEAAADTVSSEILAEEPAAAEAEAWPDWFEESAAETVEEADLGAIPPLPEEFRAEAGLEMEAAPVEPVLLAASLEAEEAESAPAEAESPCWIFQGMKEELPQLETNPAEPAETEPLVLGNRVLSEEPEFIPAAELPAEAAAELPVEPVLAEAAAGLTSEPEPEPVAVIPPISECQVIDMSSDLTDRIEQATASESPAVDPQPEEAGLLTALEAESAPAAEEADINQILASALPDDFEIPFRREEISRDLPLVEPKMAEPMGSRARALIMVGLQHWRQEDFEGALQFFDTALNLSGVFFDHSFEALCYHAIGRVKADLGCVDEAIGAYSNAACLNPVIFSSWREIGALYSRSGRYEDALSAFRKAIERDPKDSQSWNGLGDVYHKLGRPEDAISAYQLGNVFDGAPHPEAVAPASFEIETETPRVLEEMGNIHFLNSAYDEAIHAYADAIDLLEGPTDQARLWRRLGDAYQRLNEDENARSAYQKAMELDAAARSITEAGLSGSSEPAGPVTRNFVEELIASAQAAAEGQEPETLEEADSLSEIEEPERILTFSVDPVPPFIEEDPETEPEPALAIPEAVPDTEPEAAYWYFKSRAASHPAPQPAPEPERSSASTVPANPSVGAGKPTPSFVLPKYSSQAALDKPLLTAGYADPAVMVLEDTPEEEASLQFEPSILLDEETRPVAAAEPETDNENGEPAAAMETPAVAEPIPAQSALEAGANLHTLENDISTYKRVTEINPLNDRAWDALGNMYEATGLHSEAIAAFEKAISLASQREVYHYHLGLAHAAQKRYDKAIQSMQMVVALNPDYVLAHCALAGLYRRTHKDAEAREHMVIARPYMESENYYNQACFEAICGNTDRAFAFLKNALDKQQVDPELVQSDPDLDFIREDPRYRQLVSREEPVYQVVP